LSSCYEAITDPRALRSCVRTLGTDMQRFAVRRIHVVERCSASLRRQRRRMERAMPLERTVYVVTDDGAVRGSLERLLRSAGLVVVAYHAFSALLDATAALPSGCVLLDIGMPSIDGSELQKRLRDLGGALPVIVMTGQGDVQTAVRAMKAGAVDFIEKPVDDEVLLAAIELALSQGEGGDRDGEAVDAARRIALLSRREREVLEALLAGRPNKQIAFDLGISVRTVEVHRARMMDRLGVRQLAAAIRLAVMAGMSPDRAAGGTNRDQNATGKMTRVRLR
jgi:two-component system response regulator FixJ